VAISAVAAALGLSACLPNDPAEVIEPMAPYEPQAICEPAAKPGTVALADLIRSRWPGTWTSISRACDVGGRSEHKDGRAIDVGGVSAFNSTRARADSILRWLFDADADGHRFANARRLGLMYLVWDSRIWVANEADRGCSPIPAVASRCATRTTSTSRSPKPVPPSRPLTGPAGPATQLAWQWRGWTAALGPSPSP